MCVADIGDVLWMCCVYVCGVSVVVLRLLIAECLIVAVGCCMWDECC